MYDLKFGINGKDTLQRVNKTTARKIYESGREIILTPCKCRPINDFYGLSMPVGTMWEGCSGRTFDEVVNAYEMYNCNSETGKYAAYYMEA